MSPAWTRTIWRGCYRSRLVRWWQRSAEPSGSWPDGWGRRTCGLGWPSSRRDWTPAGWRWWSTLQWTTWPPVPDEVVRATGAGIGTDEDGGYSPPRYTRHHEGVGGGGESAFGVEANDHSPLQTDETSRVTMSPRTPIRGRRAAFYLLPVPCRFSLLAGRTFAIIVSQKHL